MPRPVVSVVVPTRGGADRLPILLDALARQEIDVSWEVVVVLDGDIDGSRVVLESHAKRVPLGIVELTENRGRSAALNAGFERTRGEVLIRCDDDLVPGPDYLARHAGRHAGEAVGVVGLCRNVFPDTAYARAYGRDWDERFRREAYATAPGRTWRYWAGNCSVLRETWERVGPYDAAFRAYGYEDVDWGYRLAALGVPVVLDPRLETEHRIAATTSALRAQRAYCSGAARARFELKHALQPDRASTPTAWDRLVSSLARRIGSDERALTLGRRLDGSVGLLPPLVRTKAIALAVEAAGEAGRRDGSRDLRRETRRPPSLAINVIYDMSLDQHAEEFREGLRPTLLPYGMERLRDHDLTLLDAPRLPTTRLTTIFEHRSGIRLQPLRALPWAHRADVTFAIWEHWAELPALLRHLPGPYGRKPLITLVCWAAEDLRSGDARGALRARRVIDASDLIFHLSHNQRDIFLQHGAREDQLVWLPFGVSTDFFAGDVDDEREVDFVSVGVDRGRDYDTLCQAVEGTELRVTLLTQAERARSLRLPTNIEPRGVLPPRAYRDLLARAKVVVVPTHDLAYPSGQTVALNAAASGCAVIVTGTRPMAEYFTDGHDALMPPPHDPAALRAAMRRLLHEPQFRTMLARRGQDHVRERHRSDTMWDLAAAAMRARVAAAAPAPERL